MNCHRRDTCRLCGSRDLQMVFALTPTPPANAFVPAPEPQECFPLDVFFCNACTHVQLLDVVDPSILFAHYVYVSGTSPVFVNHFKRYAQEMAGRFKLGKDSLVVDIGSNDGTLLRQFKDLGCRVLGIDPAEEISRQANAAGIETINGFFTSQLAGTLPKADLIVANNVFAHIDNLRDVVAGIRTMLQPTGAFVFEVSYLKDVVEKTLFDTIYHEHLDYHAVKPLVKFFHNNGMELIACESVDAHGGSLRGTAALPALGARQARPIEPSVAEFVRAEERLGLDKADTYRKYADQINRLKTELVTLLRRLKSEGKRIAAFGAPAKATTLMYHFGVGPDVVEFIVDDSPLKQGLYSPGYHIPVVPSSAIAERKPDYLVILAWNFADSIIAKNRTFPGHWIVPVPSVKVV